MTLRNAAQLMCLMCLLSLGLHSHAQAAESLYRFAYVESDGDWTYDLVLIDPLAPETSHRITLPETSRFTGFDPSPDGRFAVLLFDEGVWDNDEVKFLLLDMTTATYTLMAQADQSTLGPRYLSMAWSPDSAYYAFTYIHYGPRSQDDLELAFYSVETQALTSVFRFPLEDTPTDLAWSADSRKLAFIFESSSNAATIFNIPDLKNPTSIGFFIPGTSVGRRVCQSSFSPDSRYLSFEGGCIDQFPFFPAGVFTWDTTYLPERGQPLKEVVNAPVSLINEDQSLLPVFSYAPIWYDNEHLLVGSLIAVLDAETGFQQDTYQQQTSLYNVVTGESRLVSPDELDLWAVNPINGLWAYRRQPAVTSFSPRPDEGNRLWPDSDPSQVEISTFDGETFTPQIIAPSANGSQLWSPDGQFLAYAGFRTSGDDPLPLIFVETRTETISQVMLPSSVSIGGWVVFPESE